MKTCIRCGILKDETEFYHKRKDRRADCKVCHNKEKKQWRILARTQALEILGGKCKGCGETDQIVLAIDHINNNGAEERKHIDNDVIYTKIIRGNVGNYQVLSHNCNWRNRVQCQTS